MIVSCIHYKGGVGKTTTCCNLAGAAYAAGLRVLCIDLDPQGSASVYFEAHEGPTAFDWLKGDESLADSAARVRPAPAADGTGRLEEVAEGAGSIHIIRSDERLSTLQAAIRQSRRLDLVAERCAAPEAKADLSAFDYVLIDCPPGADYLSENALRASDVVLSTMQLAYMSVEGLLRVAANLRLARDEGYDPQWLVLPTMYQERRVQTRRVHESLRGQLGEFPSGYMLDPIRRSVDLSYAYDAKQTVFEYDATGRGAACYRRAFEQIDTLRQKAVSAQEGVSLEEHDETPAGEHAGKRSAGPVRKSSAPLPSTT